MGGGYFFLPFISATIRIAKAIIRVSASYIDMASPPSGGERTPSGELYLTPIQNAAVSVVDPFGGADSLLVNALNVGKLCMPEQPDMVAVRAAMNGQPIKNLPPITDIYYDEQSYKHPCAEAVTAR